MYNVNLTQSCVARLIENGKYNTTCIEMVNPCTKLSSYHTNSTRVKMYASKFLPSKERGKRRIYLQ